MSCCHIRRRRTGRYLPTPGYRGRGTGGLYAPSAEEEGVSSRSWEGPSLGRRRLQACRLELWGASAAAGGIAKMAWPRLPAALDDQTMRDDAAPQRPTTISTKMSKESKKRKRSLVNVGAGGSQAEMGRCEHDRRRQLAGAVSPHVFVRTGTRLVLFLPIRDLH